MNENFADLDPASRRRFRSAVRRWYSKHGRDLPWSGEKNPYRVWVREIMLQQTTVAAVVPYLKRFFERFPSVESLADANEEDVLKSWEGLGYYSRAKNLHKTARIVTNDRGGSFPQSVDELQSLPGIGRYTAGAIASFAFENPAPIVEANTARLFARIIGLATDVSKPAGQKALWSFADQIVPQKATGDFNQALMDLGATVCTAKEPRCSTCPVRPQCVAFRTGRVGEIPLPKMRVKPTELTEICLAIEHRGRFLTRLRPDNELWAGLWDYPRFSLRDRWTDPPNRSKSWQLEPILPGFFPCLEADAREMTNLSVTVTTGHGEIRHSVTRYRIRLICVSGTKLGGRLRPTAGLKWATPAEISHLPMTKTAREFSNHLLAETDW